MPHVPTAPRVVSAGRWLNGLQAGSPGLRWDMCRRVQQKADWSIGPSATDQEVIHYIEHGCFHFQFAGGPKQQLQAGGVLWTSPGTVRRFWANPQDTACKVIRLRFSIRHSDLLRLKRSHLLYQQAAEYRSLFERLIDLGEGASNQYVMQRRRGLLLTLCGELLASQQTGQGTGRSLSPAQRRLLHRFVHSRLPAALEPADLATCCDLSLDYFTRLFRTSYGIPPRQWLVQERLRVAAELLAHSNMSARDIATELGYQNPQLFGRQFKQHFGLTPITYRHSVSRQSQA